MANKSDFVLAGCQNRLETVNRGLNMSFFFSFLVMNLPRLIHRGSGLKTHNCHTEIFKALVQVSVDSCDGAMKETFSCLWFLIPQRRARSIDGWLVGVENERRLCDRPFILSLKGRRSKGSEAAGRQSSQRVGIAPQQKVCQMDANPNLTFACLPAPSTPT